MRESTNSIRLCAILISAPMFACRTPAAIASDQAIAEERLQKTNLAIERLEAQVLAMRSVVAALNAQASVIEAAVEDPATVKGTPFVELAGNESRITNEGIARPHNGAPRDASTTEFVVYKLDNGRPRILVRESLGGYEMIFFDNNKKERIRIGVSSQNMPYIQLLDEKGAVTRTMTTVIGGG